VSSIQITNIEFMCGHLIVTYVYEEEPYHLCNTHLRTWRA
jgi:hypothetical protein